MTVVSACIVCDRGSWIPAACVEDGFGRIRDRSPPDLEVRGGWGGVHGPVKQLWSWFMHGAIADQVCNDRGDYDSNAIVCNLA